MKLNYTKLIFAIVGILVAVYVYWLIWKNIRPRFYDRFEDLASAQTQVAPVSDIPKTKKELEYLFDKGNLPNQVLDSRRVERPYLTNPINSLDDYEYNLVFQNEGSRELSQETKNVLTSAYPFDWSVHPPASAVFQAGQSDLYQAKPTDPIPTDTYKAIEAASLQPPDMDKVEEEERKILATYAPKHAGDLKTYNIEDAKELIHKIYDAKGLKPEVVESQDNVYQVVYTTPKDPKIIYEDDPEPSVGGQMYSNPRSFDVIAVPGAVADTSAALDPFYEPRNNVRVSRTDYTRWTPGLERQFAPTYEKKEWY